MKDIEIAQANKMNNIKDVADKLNIPDEDLEMYGKYKAKINYELTEKLKDKQDGKLILVTAINPTPSGEGKTTISIGLSDALNRIGKKSILALREPSLGPVFGLKGGAAGGGYAQVVPMEDINLHFTGDIHAITAANNLLAAMIDNHIFQGNQLKIKNVTWKRCMDMNDRQLRNIEDGLGGGKNGVPRKDGFDISVASEIMAIFCLATSLQDLKERLGNIIIGYNEDDEPVRAKDIKAEGAMTVLLKDAIKPNLVQTLEHNPAIIHGGPFANIAHGCNSVSATKLGLKLADYVVTEAGFGADLGAEKFLDIKCRVAGLKPSAVVIVATIKALKYHGGVRKEDLGLENVEALEKGSSNLFKHIENITENFKMPAVVAINKFITDSEAEIELLTKKASEKGIKVVLTEVWAKGSEGGEELAQEVVRLCEKESTLNYTYDLQDDITTKIDKIAKKIYGADGIIVSDEAKEKIEKIEKMGYSNLPVCIAKTQYSLSDDPTILGHQSGYKINIRDVRISAGAGFVVVLTGNVLTMPGLPKKPAAEEITIDENGNTVGLF